MLLVDHLAIALRRDRQSVTRWRTFIATHRRKLFANIRVGVAIALILQFFESSHAVGWMRDRELDLAMRLFAGTDGTEIRTTDGRIYPVALLDVDDATVAAWDDPLFVPRDALLALVRFAVENRAALVVVDVVLNHEGDAGADRLRAYLRQYARTCRTASGAPGPTVLLERGFRSTARPGIYAAERSFVDPLALPARCVFWASPLFDAGEPDGVVRRWRQWESYQGDGSERIPSTQLAIAALLGSGDPSAAFAALRDSLARRPSDPLRDDSEPARRLDELVQESHADALGTRIFYTIPWRDRHFAASFSAQAITDRSGRLASGLSDDPVRGRLVLVGGTAANADMHATPIGLMPGSLILLNAVRSLEMHHVMRVPPWWGALLIETALIVMMSLVFLVLRSFWAMLLSALLIIVAVPFTTFRFLNVGIFIDVAIPLIAVLLHALHQRYEELHDAAEEAAPCAPATEVAP